MRSILKEPLVHFLLAGGLVFWLYGVVSPAQEASGQFAQEHSQVILVNKNDVDRLEAGFEGVWRRPPTEEEASGLVDAFITEEVLVREARKLGLENGDSVVRQRLRLKLEFLIEGAVMPADPGDEVLQAFLEEQAEQFSVSGRVAFQQVYLGDAPSESEVEAVIKALQEGAAPETVGKRTLLPASMPLSPLQAVDGTFGTGVFDALMDSPRDSWEGPLRSGYGYHFVRVTESQAVQIPPLDAIRDSVLVTWQNDQTDLRKAEQIEAFRAAYDVQILTEDGV